MIDEVYIPSLVLHDSNLSPDAKLTYGMLLLEQASIIFMDASLEKRLGIPKAELLESILELANNSYLRLHASVRSDAYQIKLVSIEITDLKHIKKASQSITLQKHHERTNPNQLELF